MKKNLGGIYLGASRCKRVAVTALRAAAYAALCWGIAAQAAPRVPTSDAEVLEQLPMRPADPAARELAQLRAQVRTAAAQNPSDPRAATALAESYFDLAMARGDPRYVGYADAVIQPFDKNGYAPLSVVRGQLLQYRHQFDEALREFESALKVDPQFAPAHAWRGAIYMVQANYPAAQKECDALQRLGRAALQAGCTGLLQAYTGRMQAGFATLQSALQQTQDPNQRLWLLTRLGEVSAWRGQSAQAGQYFRSALALGLDDGYLLAAWSDFLLDQNRPAEVVKWLANWEASDTLLLRLALAETQLQLPKARAHVQALDDRFAAARQRGDTTHRAEEARFWLQLRGNPTQALTVAAANYQVQREPRDARIVLEAALAARDSIAAKPVQDWLQSSGFEDPRLRQMAAVMVGGKQ
jgi:tetratricopeptide (TPR) repeat protein